MSRVLSALRVSALMWASLVTDVLAEDSQATVAAANDMGPWGFGGAYLFGFLLAFVFFGIGLALHTREAHLAENDQ